jgi:hypothetical protein
VPPLSRVALYQCTVLRAIHLQLGLQAHTNILCQYMCQCGGLLHQDLLDLQQ